MSIRVKSYPHIDNLGSGESGIHTVVRNYYRLAPDYGIEFVPHEQESFDVLAIHAGTAGHFPKNGNIVAHLHGLYFTGDYNMPNWAYRANEHVIESARHAKIITVPSNWVGEILRRDMRVDPVILPHGINADNWPFHEEKQGFVVGYAKNRAGVDVCDPSFLISFADRFPNIGFASTFKPPGAPKNVREIGVVPHDEMRKVVSAARVYINTTKETFGIGMLEAMACGTPVLAFNHGGAADIITHGVNGYLAVPNNYDDLAQGMVYCWEHAYVLGANAARMVREKYSWHRPMEILADVYRQATMSASPTIGVVVPVYNKEPAQLERALDSVMAQTVLPREVVVVDDGSADGDVYVGLLEKYGRDVRLVRQENSGVAEARNRGIEELSTKYVICLDADDALDPLFSEACLPELEADNSLGIAYTGLTWVKPDGSTGVSEWPGKFDYDRFLQGQNQVPTACMFRREAWLRTGGYHSRYCPRGAGEEDANFWLRIGAIGYGAKKVTDAGLFIYSWQSGLVSGADDHTITDWRGLLPYVKDNVHPLASRATPIRISHEVYQYDEPSVSVVIPVGTGHEKIVKSALDTIESQSYRKWEAIVVWDSNSLAGLEELRKLLVSYPYVRLVWSSGPIDVAFPYDIPDPVGAGAARNRGAGVSRGEYLLFLDADDQLNPDALTKMLDEMGRGEAGIYSDYVGKAIVDDVSGLAQNLQDNIIYRNERTNETSIIYHLRDFDPVIAKRQPQDPPYIWCNITTLIPRHWHDEVGGFDESMLSWEDVDYWYRMAWSGKEFRRIPEPLMMYRLAAGNRRQAGLHNWSNLLEYLRNKRKNYDGM